MSFWRRRPAARTSRPAAVPLGLPVPLPEPPRVPAPPSDAAAVGALLEQHGLRTGPVDLLGSAGDLPVWAVEEPSGEDAVARWRQVRAVHAATGLWPVVLGPRDAVGETFAFADGGEHLAGALDEGLATTAAQVLTRLAEGSDGDDSPLREQPELPPTLSALPELFDVGDGPCLLGLVPAPAGWQVPGLVSWEGAANLDSGPADHVAVLRHWEARFGAELVVLTHDTVALAVARPPLDAGTVVQAAREQYAYCPDAVDQGVGSLQALCQEQVVRRSWSFWWD